MNSLIFLIIVLLLIFRFTSLYNSTIENFSSSSTAKLSFIADDHLYVYHLKAGSQLPKGRQTWWRNKSGFKRIGYVKCCNKLVKMNIPNFKGGDKIVFYYLNTGGPGYIAGHIFWNGTYYPTNNVDYKCTGVYSKYKLKGRHFRPSGKRIGCFRDGPRRRVRFVAGYPMSNEKCREIAHARKHKYYSLQYGGQCFTDYSLWHSVSYGRIPNWRCNMKGKTGKTRWTQRQGGGWANDLYDTSKAPNLRHCGRANKRGIHEDAYRIKTAQGPYCSHSELGWVEITFATEASDLVDTKFCPDPRYTEFNGAACSSNDDVESCSRTPKKGFEVDKSKCINLYKVNKSNYENKDFFTLISIAITRNIKLVNSKLQKKFTVSSVELLKLACSIKSIAGKLEYDQEDKCEKQIEEIIINGKNTHQFFGLVKEASALCKNPKIGNPSLCNAFKEKLRNVIRHARRINFTANDKQFSCSCPEDLVNGSSIVAKDTALYIAKYDSTSQRPYRVRNYNFIGNMTISVWLRPTNKNRWRENFFHAGYGGEGTITLEKRGQLSYYYGPKGSNSGGYQWAGSRKSIPNNKLTHVTLVRDFRRRVITWYINGKVSSTTRTKHTYAGRTSWAPFIGKGYTHPYKGQFHHLRIYKRVLSPKEIMDTFKEGLVPKNTRKCGPC